MCATVASIRWCVYCSCVLRNDVKSSRLKWPRGQNFGLGVEASASASASVSRFWPRPGLDLVVLLCNRHFSCKNRVKFRNFVNFSGNNLKSCVVNHYLVLFHNYFWPRPRSSRLGLEALVLASRFWPRLTSLVLRCLKILLFLLTGPQSVRSVSLSMDHEHGTT